MKVILSKKSVLALAFAIAVPMIFSACDDDDDVSVSQVPDEVVESFREMYGPARNAEWEIESQYYVAEFVYNGFYTEAWYSGDGDWAMSETDYGMQTAFLPVAVQGSFNQSKYADYNVDDVSLYEKPVSSFCVIEVDGPYGNEVSLFYDTYGNLLNTVSGDDFEITPDTDPYTFILMPSRMSRASTVGC